MSYNKKVQNLSITNCPVKSLKYYLRVICLMICIPDPKQASLYKPLACFRSGNGLRGRSPMIIENLPFFCKFDVNYLT